MVVRSKVAKVVARKKNLTLELAYWFWTEIKGEEWNFNHPLCKGTMRDAKNLIKPKEGTGVTTEEVKRTIEYIVKDMRDEDVKSNLSDLTNLIKLRMLKRGENTENIGTRENGPFNIIVNYPNKPLVKVSE